MANMNPSAKAGETDIIAARREAAAKLQPLFVESGKDDKGNPTPGVFHTFGIKKVMESSPEYAKYIDELRSNLHARSLAVVAAARGNKNFPVTLVAEFLSGEDRTVEDQKWFAEVYLGGLAAIFAATGVGLMLPPTQAGIDFARAARSVFSHLSDEERKRFGVGEETPRRQLETDLLAIAGEQSAPLTAVQQLCRWMERKMGDREERRAAKAAAVPTEDAAAALPQAPPPEPPPASPAGPVIPDLSALTGGGSSQSPAPSKPASKPKRTATVPTAPVVAPPSAPPAAEPNPAPAPATATADEDCELILAAIEAAGTPAAKAMLSLVRAGKKTVAEAAAWATSKGLL